MLSTPITTFLDMEWAELLAWHEEASILAKQRGL
jgi:hypothetical protein